MRRWHLLTLLLLLLLLAACGEGNGGVQEEAAATVPPSRATLDARLAGTPGAAAEAEPTPAVDLSLADQKVALTPLPLRAGVPFSVSLSIQNNLARPAVDVPVMVYVSAEQEEIGYTSFLDVFSVTVPASQSLAVEVPVQWNFAGGEHQLWVQVNRLPLAWQTRGDPILPHPFSTLPETETADNIVLRKVEIDPFDAYHSDLCPGRVDVEIGPADVLPEPNRQRVLVRVHNPGNRAVYNLPVVVLGDGISGIAYTPAIPPCGGTAEVYVPVDRPFEQGESLAVEVNPVEWADSLQEDDLANNRVTVAAGLAPGMVVPPGSGLEDYDFGITASDVETPETYILLVTVHNLGTRDAAMVPILIQNAAGRKLTDAIPLVQGSGTGVAAIRAGYLWTRGGTLTITVNPADAKNGYPEANRENNVATFQLP